VVREEGAVVGVDDSDPQDAAMLEGSIRNRVSELRRTLGDLRARSEASGPPAALNLSPRRAGSWRSSRDSGS
jgi:hypothetical protein